MPRILLIEDEEGIGSALEYQLARQGYELEWVTDGTEGLARFKAAGADLILLDLMLPGLPGDEVCKQVRRVSDVPIIMLTAKDSEVDKIVGLELGADDYLTKPFSTPELIARIKAVMRRAVTDGVGSGGVLEGGSIRLDPERFEVTRDGEPVRLSRKEFELLQVLMERSGRVLQRERLIEEVWGTDYQGDTRTLDVHMKRLRDKLETDPRAPVHLLTIRGVGYRFLA
jgi:two-component system response regulator RegX3